MEKKYNQNIIDFHVESLVLLCLIIELIYLFRLTCFLLITEPKIIELFKIGDDIYLVCQQIDVINIKMGQDEYRSPSIIIQKT